MPHLNRNITEWLDRSPVLRPAVLWLATATVAGSLVVTFGVVAWNWLHGPRPPELRHGPAQNQRPGRLLLAGSGSNVPLTRLLAAQCRQEGVEVLVDEGIGSTGGLRALAEGTIDIALVSRPLRPDERHADYLVRPYAQVAVAIATHPDLTLTDVTSAQLLAIFRGDLTIWPSGTAVTPLQREDGDSSHAAVAQRLPAFAAVDRAAREARRWRMLYHDHSMHEALLGTPGAVGLVDASAVRAERLSLRLMKVDGMAPEAEALASGRYPFAKSLAFVTRTPIRPEVQHFLDCVASPVGAAAILGVGSLPVADVR